MYAPGDHVGRGFQGDFAERAASSKINNKCKLRCFLRRHDLNGGNDRHGDGATATRGTIAGVGQSEATYLCRELEDRVWRQGAHDRLKSKRKHNLDSRAVVNAKSAVRSFFEAPW